jgi:hypothetical protein
MPKDGRHKSVEVRAGAREVVCRVETVEANLNGRQSLAGGADLI